MKCCIVLMKYFKIKSCACRKCLDHHLEGARGQDLWGLHGDGHVDGVWIETSF